MKLSEGEKLFLFMLIGGVIGMMVYDLRHPPKANVVVKYGSCECRHDINGNTHTGCNLFTVRENKNESR